MSRRKAASAAEGSLVGRPFTGDINVARAIGALAPEAPASENGKEKSPQAKDLFLRQKTGNLEAMSKKTKFGKLFSGTDTPVCALAISVRIEAKPFSLRASAMTGSASEGVNFYSTMKISRNPYNSMKTHAESHFYSTIIWRGSRW
jgi:hypothetical protein